MVFFDLNFHSRIDHRNFCATLYAAQHWSVTGHGMMTKKHTTGGYPGGRIFPPGYLPVSILSTCSQIFKHYCLLFFQLNTKCLTYENVMLVFNLRGLSPRYEHCCDTGYILRALFSVHSAQLPLPCDNDIINVWQGSERGSIR